MDFMNFIVMDVGLIIDFTSLAIFILEKLYLLLFYTLEKWCAYVTLVHLAKTSETPLRTRSAHDSPNLEILAAHKRRVDFDRSDRRLNSKPGCRDHGFYTRWQALRWCMVGWLSNATLWMRTCVGDGELRASERKQLIVGGI